MRMGVQIRVPMWVCVLGQGVERRRERQLRGDFETRVVALGSPFLVVVDL
jgi:hypothetical protein